MRKLKHCFSLLVYSLLVLAVIGPASMAKAQDWGYACQNCPTNWGNLDPAFAACRDGEMQTPICISSTDAQVTALPDLLVMFEDFAGEFEVERLATNFEAFPEHEGVGLKIGDTEYDFVQFHFHSLSEHFLDGEQFPLEVHFVHKTAAGELAVLGAFIKEGDQNDQIAELIDSLDVVAGLEEGTHIVIEGFDPRKLLPETLGGTFRYTGSTTTPPCVADVEWLMLREPITFSSEQVEAIQTVIRGFNSGFDNNRPLQSRNGRTVFSVDAPTSVESTPNTALPKEFLLEQNHPNPFNPGTTITFEVPKSDDVTLEIYNLRGRLIKTLYSGPIAAGRHGVVWDGTDNRGNSVASATYFYKLKAGDVLQVKKMSLLK